MTYPARRRRRARRASRMRIRCLASARMISRRLSRCLISARRSSRRLSLIRISRRLSNLRPISLRPIILRPIILRPIRCRIAPLIIIVLSFLTGLGQIPSTMFGVSATSPIMRRTPTACQRNLCYAERTIYAQHLRRGNKCPNCSQSWIADDLN
jgi:hypothetical protein